MKLILPLSVTIPRKRSADKIVPCNLNFYRNAYFQVLNQAKHLYKDEVQKAWMVAHQSGADVEPPPYQFIYTVYPANNRKFDLGNVLSIVQKFTDDSLIDLGLITDDSYKIVREVVYRFGGADKDFPRVELEIKSWTE